MKTNSSQELFFVVAAPKTQIKIMTLAGVPKNAMLPQHNVQRQSIVNAETLKNRIRGNATKPSASVAGIAISSC